MENGVCQLFLKFAYWVTAFWIRWPDYNGRTNIYISYNYFGNIFVYIAKTSNNDKQILWELYNVAIFDMPSVRLT